MLYAVKSKSGVDILWKLNFVGTRVEAMHQFKELKARYCFVKVEAYSKGQFHHVVDAYIDTTQ